LDNDILLYYNKSLEDIDEAKKCIEFEAYGLAVNRSYYAVFHVATALLLKKGISVKSHAGVQQQFALNYVHNSDFNKEIFKYYSQLEDNRLKSDYSISTKFTLEKAEKNIDLAELFIEECQRFL
jgi:uncharacterized protein (UPF0332 family)